MDIDRIAATRWRKLAPMRASLACAASAVFAVLAVLAVSPAIADDIEAKVEAAYLYHLTKFVDWPTLPANEFRICVFGAEAVGSMMSSDLSGRQVRERALKIEVNAVDASACQILFIGRGDKRLPDMLQRVRGAPVLTVSDLDDFARRGGMVGFYVEAGKIKLEINPEVAHAANLRLSAKLREVARSIPAAYE